MFFTDKAIEQIVKQVPHLLYVSEFHRMNQKEEIIRLKDTLLDITFEIYFNFSYSNFRLNLLDFYSFAQTERMRIKQILHQLVSIFEKEIYSHPKFRIKYMFTEKKLLLFPLQLNERNEEKLCVPSLWKLLNKDPFNFYSFLISCFLSFILLFFVTTLIFAIIYVETLQKIFLYSFTLSSFLLAPWGIYLFKSAELHVAVKEYRQIRKIKNQEKKFTIINRKKGAQ